MNASPFELGLSGLFGGALVGLLAVTILLAAFLFTKKRYFREATHAHDFTRSGISKK